MLAHNGTVDINTERLYLRRFKLTDVNAMFRNWASDPDVARFVTWPAHQNTEVTGKIIQYWVDSYSEDNYYCWAIVPKDKGEPIGSISVVGSSNNNESCEVGYCIGKRFWSKGYTTEALKSVIAFLIKEVGYERIHAKHQVENPASGKVMIKAGMSLEGCMRHAYKNRDGNHKDLLLYSLISSEV